MPVIEPSTSALKRTPTSTACVSVVSMPAGVVEALHNEHGHDPVDALFTVTETGDAAVWLPAGSRAIAPTVCVPFATPVVFQEKVYGAVVMGEPTAAPSIVKVTDATLMLSAAVAERATAEPDTVPPAVGEVIETDGGVV